MTRELDDSPSMPGAEGDASARDFINVANVITASGLAVGFVSVILAGDHQTVWAAVLIGIAFLLDGADGLMARKLSCCGRFGAELDSLNDIVSFGVAPAMLLYSAGLETLPVAGIAVCLTYLMGGAWRLARFPLVRRADRFVGLPIPVAGLIAAGTAVWGPAPGLTLVITLVLAALMVSELPFPTLQTFVRIARALGPDRPVEVDEPVMAEAATSQAPPQSAQASLSLSGQTDGG